MGVFRENYLIGQPLSAPEGSLHSHELRFLSECMSEFRRGADARADEGAIREALTIFAVNLLVGVRLTGWDDEKLNFARRMALFTGKEALREAARAHSLIVSAEHVARGADAVVLRWRRRECRRVA
ncbi:MAG TPA: hypothetical protein VE913_19095 [Longimicrobium sp.]|nr:hypothetical protein [Longimicrobium sp.]